MINLIVSIIIKINCSLFFSNNFYLPEDISVITTRYNTFTERIIALGLQDDVDSKTILSVGAFPYTPISLLMQLLSG